MIAISYRREDSLPIAGRLYDRLQAEFGTGNVFMDFDSIPYGVDFREHIKQMIDRSKVLVAIIGPDWLGKRRQRTRRIDDPADFVRLEIAYALQGGIPVIPVLINDTAMPKAPDLPAEIEALAFRNAVTLHAGIDFHHHADRLVVGINRLVIASAKSAVPKPMVPKIARTVETPLTPALFPEQHALEHSKRTPETSGAVLQESAPTKPAKVPPPLPQKPEGPEPSKSEGETPWWSSLWQKFQGAVGPIDIDSFKASFRKPRKLIIVGIIAVISLFVGILFLYFGSTRSNILPNDSRPLAKVYSAPAGTVPTASASAVVPPAVATATAATAPPPTVEKGPEDPKFLARSRFRLAQEALQQHQLATALTFADQADEADPNQPSILNLRGEILMEQMQLERATAAFEKAIEIDPNFSEAHSNLAQARLKKEATGTLPAKAGSPSARNNRAWDRWIGEFVKEFVSANRLQDVNEHLAFYASKVDYLDHRQQDQSYVRKDVENYNERWPTRRDTIEGDINLIEKQFEKEYAARFKLNFYAESAARSEWSKGQSEVDLQIIVVDGVPRISGIKQRILRGEKGTGQGVGSDDPSTTPTEAKRNSFGIIEGTYACQYAATSKTRRFRDKTSGQKDVVAVTYDSKFIISGERFSHFFSLNQQPTAAGSSKWARIKYTIRADGKISPEDNGVYSLKPDRLELVEKVPNTLRDSNTAIERERQRLPDTKWVVRYEEDKLVQISNNETWSLEKSN